jgi:hypothetical protein
LLVAGILAAIGVGAIGDFVRPELGPDTVMPARFGDVVWNHEMHVRMKDIVNCQVCHHKERAGTLEPRPCRACHEPQGNRDAMVVADLHMEVAQPEYEDDKGPPPMTAFHGRCVGCHRAMSAGPVACRDCHAQEFSGAHGVVRWDHHAHARRFDLSSAEDGEDNCVTCHHQDKKAATEADYRPCGACHKPAVSQELSLATGVKFHEKVKHGECRRCHTVNNPEEDRRTCKDCHKGWDVDKEVQRPAIEQAVHQRCAECHHEDYEDLTPSMPIRCDDCHEPDPSLIADLDVGLVLWDHDRHARYGEGVTCRNCHHTDDIEQPHMACSRCHGTGLYENPQVAEALRKRCLGCHKEKENGLLAWEQIDTERKEVDIYKYEGEMGTFWWDHRDHAVAWSFSCRNCHHGTLRKDGQYVTAAKAQAAWTGEATHVQTCRNCHGPEGPVAGSPAEGSKAPRFDDAFKKICVECHARLGGGPQNWEDFFKIEPVEPVEGL